MFRIDRRAPILGLVLSGVFLITMQNFTGKIVFDGGLPKRHIGFFEATKDKDTPTCPCVLLSSAGGSQ